MQTLWEMVIALVFSSLMDWEVQQPKEALFISVKIIEIDNIFGYNNNLINATIHYNYVIEE